MTTPDPFDEGVPRGRYNRPLIIPITRGKPNLKAALVEYDRASSVADALDDAGGLTKWQTRHAASGIATNPDLAAMVAALGRNPDTFSKEDKAALDEIIERAHDRSGGNMKADYGTAIHSLTEPGNDGEAFTVTMYNDVASYDLTIDEAGIEVDATETFIVNDTLKVAGTFDHTYQLAKDITVKLNGEEITLPAGLKLIGDKKTGSLHFDAHAIQLAIYARGAIYDHNTGVRTPLDVSPTYGIIAHIAREGARTTLHLVDIAAGWEGAKLAVQARAYKLGAKKRLSAVIAVGDAPSEPDPEPAAPAVTPGFDEALVIPNDRLDEFRPRVWVNADGSTSPIVCATASAMPATRVIEAVTIDHVSFDLVGPTEGEALATVTQLLGATPVLSLTDKLRAAQSKDELSAIWRDDKAGDKQWTDEHTAILRARAAELMARLDAQRAFGPAA